MSERAWTAGPWKVHWNMGDGDYHWIMEPAQMFMVAKVEVFGPTDGDMEVMGVANAHLIAAAPCLYEALDEMITWWVEDANATDPRLGHQVACDPRVQNAVDALKRAQGGEP